MVYVNVRYHCSNSLHVCSSFEQSRIDFFYWCVLFLLTDTELEEKVKCKIPTVFYVIWTGYLLRKSLILNKFSVTSIESNKGTVIGCYEICLNGWDQLHSIAFTGQDRMVNMYPYFTWTLYGDSENVTNKIYIKCHCLIQRYLPQNIFKR